MRQPSTHEMALASGRATALLGTGMLLLSALGFTIAMFFSLTRIKHSA